MARPLVVGVSLDHLARHGAQTASVEQLEERVVRLRQGEAQRVAVVRLQPSIGAS
jgi:hypothetical protein